MNADQIKGSWKQMAGELKMKWGELTENDLEIANGNMEMLAGRIQERYGIAVEKARQQLDEFARDYRGRGENEVATEGDPLTTDDLKPNAHPS